MEKLSSGYRINKASDDPAGLVISEQFRAQIAGLEKAISNSEGSINMIQTAEGALNEINNLLVGMRELAIHAANEGFNDANQLAADQAEIDNALQTIDRIAANTQFGTKKLLDGTKENVATVTSSNSSGLSINSSGLSSGTHSLTATKTADATATLNTTTLGVSLASTTGSPYNLTDGVHNLDVIQASSGAEKYSDQVSIVDAWNNGINLGTAGAVATVASAASLSTITNRNAGSYTVTLNYQESGSSVTGDQALTVSLASSDTSHAVVNKFNAAIQANSALNGNVTATLASGVLTFQTANKGSQYSIRFSSQSQTGLTGATAAFDMGSARSARGTSLNQLQFKINTAAKDNVTATLSIAAAEYTDMDTLATAIKSGLQDSSAFGTIAASVGNVDVATYGTDKLRFFTNDEGSDYFLQHLTMGSETEQAQNVLGLAVDTIANTGTDALISFDNFTNSITSVKYNDTQDVTLYNKASTFTAAEGRGSIALTIGTASNSVDLGNLLLDVTATQFDVRLDAGPATSVTAGENAIIWNSARDEYININYDLTSNGGTETLSNVDRSLVFQIGGSVGQTATVSLRNMAASALGKNLAGNMFNSLAEIDVTTAQGAQDAQSIIDAAIDEVTTTRGTMGSFQKNTLESNLTNLRVAAQNLTASESSIRDTDMAKEMSEYVKYQILMQAGISMVAQGNQVSQVVLSLFQ